MPTDSRRNTKNRWILSTGKKRSQSGTFAPCQERNQAIVSPYKKQNYDGQLNCPKMEERGSDGSDVVTFCLEDNSRHIVITVLS